MKIIGYSGLHGSIEFRKQYYQGLTDNEYRMCQGLDSAACIIINGKVIAAAEEERFTGEKYTCNFPINAIEFCLKESGLTLHDIDYVAHGFDYLKHKQLFSLSDISKIYYEKILSPEVQIQLWKKNFPEFDIENKFSPIDHHLAHAATAYFPSGFDSALILIADGLGEIFSISLFEGRGKELKLLKNFNLYSSLGVLYSQITAHLGFWVNSDEYKVMGLAPYGDPKRYQSLFEEILEYKDEGSIFINKFKLNTTELDRQTGRAFRSWFTTQTFPARQDNEPITQEHKDLAAGLQQALEKSFEHILSFWQNKLQAKNLCMAGGVALNCTSNGNLLRKSLFEKIFIQPAASDAGTAIGAAMIKSINELVYMSNVSPFELPYYGPGFNQNEYEQAIFVFSDRVTAVCLSDESLVKEAAQWIAQGKVIAWMQDRMEFGPRALGNRSILADPTDPTMRDRINALVKKRESFRPFAPSVKLEAASKYFDIPGQSEFPHMLFTVNVREEFRAGLPSITHVNGSARLQTVNKQYSPLYWSLIDAFEKIKGVPIVLNTSFNVKGQPMVCSPTEAIETLLATNIDALFLGNYLITIR